MRIIWTLMALVVGLLSSSTISASVVGQTGPDRAWIDAVRKSGAEAGISIAGLPDARGRRFRSLDAYLAHLRRYAAPVDRPWYREVGPGIYLLETGNLRPGMSPRLFTREQLECRFGFRRSPSDIGKDAMPAMRSK